MHQAMNRGTRPLRVVVTSQPPSHGDRVTIEKVLFCLHSLLFTVKSR
jgi:hypothetical protein